MRDTAVLVAIVLLLAACSDPSPRRDRDNDAARRAEARRELERDCRMAAETRTYDPRCPQPEDNRTAQPPPALPRLPQPSVGLPSD